MGLIKLSDCGVKFGTSGVRGLVTELTDQICYAYTAAFWSAVGQGDRVVIGHDLRPSSPAITSACIAALKDSGVEALYVGALPTPAIAYFALQQGLPSIVVTGSHIPFDRNGIKFYRAEGEISKADEASILAAQVDVPEQIQVSALPEAVVDAEQLFLDRYRAAFSPALCKGLRIAVYQHSSVARDLLCQLFESFGAEVIPLGRAEGFVPIDTEAVREEDKVQAKIWAKEHDFDLLVSTDGDADRPLIADENGDFLRGDLVGALCAYYLGIMTLVTPVSSNTLAERSGWFELVTRTKIGSPYVIEAMQGRTLGSVAGYEANGGFLLGSDVKTTTGILHPLPTRDAVLPMLALIALAQLKDLRLSELSSLVPARYTASDRIPETPTEWSRSLLKRLDAGELALKDLIPVDLGELQTVDRTDGYRGQFEQGSIVHLRPSGNAPELRCYTESESETLAEQLCAGTLEAVTRLYKSER